MSHSDRDAGDLVPEDDGGFGDLPDAPVCASIKVDLSHNIPTIALLVDESGSMSSSFGNTTRWDAVYSTLMNPTDGVVKQLQADVRFGLYMFTDGLTCPKMTVVRPAVNNYTSINNVYSQGGPDSNTPTGEAIAYTKTALQAVTDPGAKIIVLATDGEPNGCGFGSGTQLEIQNTQAAFQAGIRTYVIGVASGVSAQNLQDVANVGVGKPVGANPAAPYWQAQNPQQIVDAFRNIINTVQNCTFTLNGQIAANSAQNGTVTLDGNPLVYGVDWTVEPDGRTLDLLGATCDLVKAGGSHDLEAQFPCEIVIGRHVN